MTRRKHFGPLSGAQQAHAETCLPLALNLAMRMYRTRGEEVELEHLKSAAHVGLCQAAKAFDPARGYQFTTLAWPAILNALKAELKRSRRPRPQPISATAVNSVVEALNAAQAPVPAESEELWQHLLTRLLPYDDDRGRLATIMHRRRDGDTLQEIGNDLGISKERVRQIVVTAVRRAGGMEAVLDGTGFVA